MIEAAQSNVIKGLDPVADAFAATVSSDVINCKNLDSVEFLIYKGVGTTGTSTITVEACDDVTPTTTSAVAFYSQAITTGDTAGALTARAAAGFDTTAGSGQIYRIYADVSALAASGYGYIRLKCVEVVDSPVVGCIIAIGHAPRYQRDVMETAIV